MQQYFVNKINDKFILKEEDLYHLVTVLRAKEKRKIICLYNNKKYLCYFNGNSFEYSIDIIEELINDSELNTDIILYQALIRNENFDLVLQKATELGAKKIVPTIFNRNVVKIDDNKKESKLKRFKTIVKNSSEQSHRGEIPEIGEITSIKNIKIEDGEIGIVCYENENTKTLFNIKQALKKAKIIKIVIGPEGGITKEEFDLLIKNGFTSISLGKRILRSETAAFNILSIISYLKEIDES